MLDIVALDPGGTTGICIFWQTPDTDLIRTDSFSTWQSLDKYIKPESIVIVEKPFMSIKVDPIVFEVAGACYERAYSKNCTLIHQAPNTPEFMMKRHSLDGVIHGSQHQKDAWCHMAFYLISSHDWTLLRCLQSTVAGEAAFRARK